MPDIQEQYQEYAFLPDPALPRDAIEDVVEDSTIGLQIVNRTYEQKWYFIVYAPYDKSYAKDPEWYQVKALDYCRQKLRQAKAYVLTRETEANKTHINALVCSSFDYNTLHGKTLAHKFKRHVTELKTPADRHNVLRYIQKESAKRSFIKYLDYITSR